MSNRAEEKWGMLQVFTGNGKGKTTAALGTALRAFAQGKRVGFVYFDKGGTHYSERLVLDALAAQPPTGMGTITVIATGLDRIDPVTNRFRFGVTPEDIVEATRGIAAARTLFSHVDVLVLDELASSLDLGMITEADARALLDERPKNVECICTGRNAPQWLLDQADLVTEMILVKHYFYHGATARYGLDY